MQVNTTVGGGSYYLLDGGDDFGSYAGNVNVYGGNGDDTVNVASGRENQNNTYIDTGADNDVVNGGRFVDLGGGDDIATYANFNGYVYNTAANDSNSPMRELARAA